MKGWHIEKKRKGKSSDVTSEMVFNGSLETRDVGDEDDARRKSVPFLVLSSGVLLFLVD